MADFGRVPRGSRPDGFVDIHPYTYSGPMARSVADAALMLDAMSGPDGSDPFSLSTRNGSYLEATVGVSTASTSPTARTSASVR